MSEIHMDENGNVFESSATTLAGATSVPKLGEIYDGSAEVADGLGHKAGAVFETFGSIIVQRAMPGVTPRRVSLSASALSLSGQRPYYLLQQPNGATVAVYISQFGQDLYLSWTLFVRPVWNMLVLAIIAGIAFLESLPVIANDGGIGFLVLIGGLFFWFLVAGLAGWLFKRNFFGFLFKELTIFDFEDIRAMCMITHNSLLQAADTVGIHVRAMNLKAQFFGGRRDRLI